MVPAQVDSVSSNGKPRVAVVAGLRTPFAKIGTAYRELSAQQLGQAPVRALGAARVAQR